MIWLPKDDCRKFSLWMKGTWKSICYWPVKTKVLTWLVRYRAAKAGKIGWKVPSIILDFKSTGRAVFSGVPWQRCQFHLQQNVGAHVPRQEMRREVAEDLRTIFNAPDRYTAEAYLERTIHKYAKTASTLANWLEKNIPEGLTVFSFPASHRRRLRTANGLERLSREVKRRTRVVSIFPNEAACLRLISAVLMEIHEEWQTDRMYLTLETNDSPSPP